MHSRMIGLANFILVFLRLTAVTGHVSSHQVSYARGFGDHLNWQLLDQGLRAAKLSRKPSMILFHKSWCGACRSLAPKVANSDKIAELSKNFELINVYDDEEPDDDKYFPDGGYIPRIVFLNPDGEVDVSIINEKGSDEHKFFYYNALSIVQSMQRAIQMYHIEKEL